MLSNLKDPNTYEGIWQAAQKSPRAIFMINRFEIDIYSFERAANDDGVAARVWTEAYRLAKLNGQDRITGGEVIVALISQVPSAQQLLAQSHIEYEDLVEGLEWLHHIIALQKQYANEHNFFGGVARDWTAGYTPILSKIGVNLSEQIQANGGLLVRNTESHESTIQEMIKVFAGGSNNIALVGPTGIGKTTTVEAFAEHLLTNKKLPQNLRYNKVFRVDASSLKVNLDSFSAEELVNRIFSEAIKAKNTIIFLDDAQLFFTYDIGAIDLSKVLLQILERSNVRIIMAMDTNDWQKITQENSALNGIVNKITMSPPTKDDVIQILQDQSIVIEHQHKAYFTHQALLEAYRLADHYINDLAFPAKAIKILDAATRYIDVNAFTEHSVQQAVESMVGVKVQKATQQDTQVLINLEDEIHKRMINQSRAVKVVCDAIRRARSGVNNPNKPFGTFLFLGPTGVGKTELSKAIAEVYFSGADNMIRVDMNQLDADGAIDTYLLPKIKQQPFSVVLLDEIEKASPRLLDVFLQMLDEGVMRDAQNNDVSFKDSIIIATSNAGADEIRQRIAAGQKIEEFEEEITNRLIDAGQFKPEFINRFDEIVVFRPLTKVELLQVVDIIMLGVNQTLARQKVSVALSDDAKTTLVDMGYDERLGARPLRRAVQKTVQNIVAKKLLDGSLAPGDTLQLSAAELMQESQPSN
jgi:ATP-dependent Clp protease ATP-binding subunit ClpC